MKWTWTLSKTGWLSCCQTSAEAKSTTAQDGSVKSAVRNLKFGAAPNSGGSQLESTGAGSKLGGSQLQEPRLGGSQLEGSQPGGSQLGGFQLGGFQFGKSQTEGFQRGGAQLKVSELGQSSPTAASHSQG